jgi:hypothetical protein
MNYIAQIRLVTSWFYIKRHLTLNSKSFVRLGVEHIGTSLLGYGIPTALVTAMVLDMKCTP